ncbi:MAG: phosphatase PAP2 family protein [Gemmatimonadaceae bacterium]
MNEADAPMQPHRGTRVSRFFAARLDRKSYLGLRLTVGLLIIAAGLWVFGGLLEEVLDNATLVQWDVIAASWIHSTITPAGTRVFLAITNVGSPVVMAVLATIGVAVTFLRRHHLLAYTWAAAAGGGAMLDGILKHTIHRTRPQYALALLHGSSFSFPSGHAMGSMIGYGFLAYATVLTGTRVGWHKRMIFSFAALLTLLIGVSRVYIGVHFPSDVLGGWAAGLAWLAVCITGYEFVSGRSATRRPLTPSPDTP